MSIRDYLSSNGYKATPPRLALFEIFQKAPHPMSVVDIESSDYRYDRSSIYRNIGLFKDLNVISSIGVGQDEKFVLSSLFEHNTILICKLCHQCIDAECSRGMDKKLSDICKNMGFVIETHQVSVYGVCRSCQVKSAV